MAKKSMEQTVEEGEQGYLMEVGPEGMEKIRPFVQKCAKQQAIRKAAWEKIVEAKNNIRELVCAEGLEYDANGKITFKCDGKEVEVTHKDDKVTVRDAKEEKTQVDVNGRQLRQGERSRAEENRAQTDGRRIELRGLVGTSVEPS